MITRTVRTTTTTSTTVLAGAVVAAFIVVAVVATAIVHGDVVAGARPEAGVPRLGSAAVATQSAQRLRPLPPDNFPISPTPRCSVLDNFGDPRSGGRTHEGTDIMANLGQEVYAMADGVLTYQARVGDGTSGSVLSGNLWKLTAADGTYFVYAHLSAFAPGLERGMAVYRGQLLGWVGDTGNAGPGNYHLHFEWHPGGGAAVNAIGLMTIPAACHVY